MNLRQITRADVAIGIAALVLLWALVAPALRGRSFRTRVDEAASEVERLRASAESSYGSRGFWPTSVPPGEAPFELSSTYAGDGPLRFDGYALQWTRLDAIEYEVAPPAPVAPPEPDEEEDPDELVLAPGDAPPDSVGPGMVPVVRGMGIITVHTSDTSLLAALLDRFGRTESFVRDTTWTLLVGGRSGTSAP